jgi:tetrapyrrole methylase family protein/MazG family protein
MKETLEQFERLANIVKTLMGPEGCPWDQQQTLDSIKMYLLEETHEVIEAVENKEPQEIKEELGDLLFHILFMAHYCEEREWFNLQEVIKIIADKLIRRHPHVFGDLKVENAAEVVTLWDEIKKNEKEGRISLLGGVPKTLPALERALHLTRKAARVGFDWPDADSVKKKLEEEYTELEEAIASNDSSRVEHEIGDLLFTVVNLSRFLQVNPENALRKANARFRERFAYIEEKVAEAGKSLEEVSLEEMDRLWDEAKDLNEDE